MLTPDTTRERVEEALVSIRKHTDACAEIGIILGTGLGGLAREIALEQTIEYSDINHFPAATVESHSGTLLFGTLGGKHVVAMQGRFHFYEGYAMRDITFGVHMMHALGVKTLLVSNASGGMNPGFHRGDIMIITDHINLQGSNPLIGPNDCSLGGRFPDMSEPYSRELIALAERVATSENISLKKGVYVAVTGPNLETRAEYRFLRMIGADVVGMSTVPEVIAAVHREMKVLALSVITDECIPETLKPTKFGEILATAREAEPRLTLIMKRVIENL